MPNVPSFTGMSEKEWKKANFRKLVKILLLLRKIMRKSGQNQKMEKVVRENTKRRRLRLVTNDQEKRVAFWVLCAQAFQFAHVVRAHGVCTCTMRCEHSSYILEKLSTYSNKATRT
mmetsp:Transcript_34279/g.63590  ORF Transcript_34279/g.63590 Transcript_34279/m.63590 type:complete len:116 (-) Transcript_34279:165-512(-)